MSQPLVLTEAMQVTSLYDIIHLMFRFPLEQVPTHLTIQVDEVVVRKVVTLLQGDDLPCHVRMHYSRKFGTLFLSFDEMMLHIVTFDAGA